MAHGKSKSSRLVPDSLRTLRIGPMVSLACIENRHEKCTGDCRPLLPFPCGCPCHKEKHLTS